MLQKPIVRDLAGLALLALAALGFFWRVVTGQNWMPADGGDLVSFLYPTYRFAAASLHNGAWPLWNPFLYGGAPHVGDIQAGFLYPPNLLLFLLSPDFPYTALQWLSIAHVWFAGVGMYLLLVRGWGLRRIAGLLGAIAFMFADPFLTHFGNLNLNAAASWLPWVFWAWTAALTATVSWRSEAGHSGQEVARLSDGWPVRLVVAAVVLALAISAGHIQATLFTVLGLAAYTAFFLWQRRDMQNLPREVLRTALAFSGVVLGAALLTAPILLPALELAARTSRASWNYTATAGYSLSPAQSIGWLIPGFFGRGPQFHWGAWPRVETGYLGVLPLVLAALAALYPRWLLVRHRWALAALAAFSFVLALGIYAIPHGWLTLLPGFGQMRAPARFIWVTDFALAGLAAIGLHLALRRTASEASGWLDVAAGGLARIAAAVWLVAVPLMYAVLLLMQDRDDALVIRASISLIAVLSFAGLLLAALAWLWLARSRRVRTSTLGWLAVVLVFLDVASLGAYQDLGDQDPSRTFEHGAIAAFLARQPGPFRVDTRTQIESAWQPNTALLYGLEDVTGVANPLVLADFERYWGELGSRSTQLYDLLNVKYVVAAKDVTLDWDKFAPVFEGDPQLNVYENRRALPRAFIVPTYSTQPTKDLLFDAIQRQDLDLAEAAVVLGPSSLPVPAGADGEVKDIQSGRNSLSFRTFTQSPALVFVSQIWYPGWRVYVDGQPAGAPLRLNYLFQGVTAPAGEHLIELKFEPVTWRVGWVLWGLAVVMIVALLAVLIRGRRRNDH
jgi:hypothetical protein